MLRTMFKAFLVNCLLCLPVAADWREYQSDNFVIYSDARPRSVEALLADFELFRSTARAFLNMTEAEEHARVRIYMFSNARDYRAFARSDSTAGFYVEALNGPRLVIGPGQRDALDYRVILYHEYVHYLMKLNPAFRYPRWYMEGMAELLSTVRTRFNHVEVGQAHDARVAALRDFSRMRMADLVRLETSDQGRGMIDESRFYSNAWLLTHYLIIDNFDDKHGLRRPLAHYLFSYLQGNDPLESFPGSFGMSLEEMDSRLSAYIRSGRLPVLRFDKAQFDYDGGIRSERMTRDAAAYLLASLASDLGNDELALRLLQQLEPGQRSVRANALAAVAAGHQEQYELADSLVAGLPEAPEIDEEGLAFLAHYWLDVAVDRDAGPAEREDALNRSIELSTEAIRRDENYLAAYYFLARAMAARGMVEDAENALWMAFSQFPGELHVSSLLLRLLTFQEKHERALYMMNQIYSATHEAARRQRLEGLRVALLAAQQGEEVDLHAALCDAMGC